VTALLEAHEVRKHYGGVAAVDAASLKVEPGSITSLIGPNGAGKTTLFNIVTGFVRADGGTVTLAGERVDGRPPHALARRGLVRTFQTPRALTRMTVLENVLVGAPAHPGEHVWRLVTSPRAGRRREAELRGRALELLRLVRLDDAADDYAGTLSGGQRKLLELTRALMTEPRLLLLDEPMAGVNPTLAHRLLDRIRALRDEDGLTFLLIDHDLDVVMSVSDRVIVMSEGRVIAAGTPDEVRANPVVVDAYLGTHGPGAS
jgi:ABC-type branched-subunit amino acid transport system ATPase component